MIICKGRGIVTGELSDEIQGNGSVYAYIVVQYSHDREVQLIAKNFIVRVGLDPLRKGDKIYFEGVLTEMEKDYPAIELKTIKLVERKSKYK